MALLVFSNPCPRAPPVSPTLLARRCRSGCEEKAKPQNSEKLVQRVADKSFRARSTAGRWGGRRPRLGCSRPPSCARDGAGREPPLRDAGSPHTRGSPQSSYQVSLRVTNNTPRRGPVRHLPSSPATVVAHSPATSREPTEGAGLLAAPPGRRRPPGRIKVRREGRGGCSHRAAPNARPQRMHPGWAPPGYLAAAVGFRHLPCFPTREGLESM